MTKPLIFVNYAVELGIDSPQWANLLPEDRCFVYKSHDPQIPQFTQLNPEWTQSLAINPRCLEIIPVLQSLNIPSDVMSGNVASLMNWCKSPDINSHVWRDLFFLVRSSILMVDQNRLSYGFNPITLTLAAILRIPIITVSDVSFAHTEAIYLSDVRVRSDSPMLMSIIDSLLPKKEGA